MRTCLLLLALALGTAAHADTIRNFDLTATFGSAGYIPYIIDFGAIAIDTTTGSYDPSHLSYGGIPLSSSPGDSYGYVSELFTAMRLTFSNGSHQNKYFFDIILPVTTLIGYAGGPICSDSTVCENLDFFAKYGGTPYPVSSNAGFGSSYATTGALTPLSATPEPSSVLLLGTGALSVIGIVRRKLRPFQADCCPD